eukprot:1822839-Pleurochrysis_carterae.AAC.3
MHTSVLRFGSVRACVRACARACARTGLRPSHSLCGGRAPIGDRLRAEYVRFELVSAASAVCGASWPERASVAAHDAGKSAWPAPYLRSDELFGRGKLSPTGRAKVWQALTAKNWRCCV